MKTTTIPALPEGVECLTEKEGRELLDREAQRCLGISGDEFIRRWDAGEFANDARPEVFRVSVLRSLGR